MSTARHDPPASSGEPLDHERPVGGHFRPLVLVGHVAHEVLRRRAVERALRLEPGDEAWIVESGLDLPGQFPDLPPQPDLAAIGLALPERDFGRALPRPDHDPIVGDIEDSPPVRAQDERFTDPRLVHELLVELPDPFPGFGIHPVLAGVGDRPP
ncbi:TPA: hypothetical protein DCY67_01175, partial [Candidatus Acetothermia bacterium]|nr:hypothetical protein [Candidatus Acetothermia bacterium]